MLCLVTDTSEFGLLVLVSAPSMCVLIQAQTFQV